jgi:hypothetical protein
MRDINTQRLAGTAPLVGETPPPAQRQAVQAAEAESTARIQGDTVQARKVVSSADTATRVTIGDPVAEATSKGAKTLARMVLASGDKNAIARVMSRLEMKNEDELRSISQGKSLSQDQLGKLDPQEKALLLDATTQAGAQAALEALTSRSDSG